MRVDSETKGDPKENLNIVQVFHDFMCFKFPIKVKHYSVAVNDNTVCDSS